MAQKTKQPRIVEVVFPTGGLVRNVGFQQQGPYTTPFCQNVRAYDVLNTRKRGGSRPGLTKLISGQSGSGNFVQLLDSVSIVSGPGIISNLLLTIINGSLYWYAGSNNLSAVSGWTFNTNPPQLQGAQVGLLYYVADYRETLLSGQDGVIGNSSQLASASIEANGGWTAQGINTSLDVIYIAHSEEFIANNPAISVTTGTVGITGGIATFSSPVAVYNMIGGNLTIPNVETVVIEGYISSTELAVGDPTIVVAPGTSYVLTYSYDTEDNIFPIVDVVAASGLTPSYLVFQDSSPYGPMTADTGATWQVGRLPRQINPSTKTIAAMAVTYGIPPLGCTLCCEYRGRLVLGGPGEVWYMSRVNDPTDWDYGANPGDVQRAVAGDTAPTGGLSFPITALIPHSDQYLIFAGTDAMSILNGDPAYGGQMQVLSPTIGCLGPAAWCQLPDGSIMFMSRDGLYSVPSGGGIPVPVSRPTLPAELLDVNPTNNAISMVYDVKHRGVHLSITPNSGSASGTHYWIDVANPSFWPVTYPAAKQPISMLRWNPISSSSVTNILLGGNDGYIRFVDDSATTDDGTTFTSSILYGPLRLGGAGYEGVLVHMAADLDLNSQNVTCGIFLGQNCESIVAAVLAANSPFLSYTWSAGTNHRVYPRCRNAATGLLVTGTAPWAIEDIRILARKGGVTR